jgi:hypothetical protein
MVVFRPFCAGWKLQPVDLERPYSKRSAERTKHTVLLLDLFRVNNRVCHFNPPKVTFDGEGRTVPQTSRVSPDRCPVTRTVDPPATPPWSSALLGAAFGLGVDRPVESTLGRSALPAVLAAPSGKRPKFLQKSRACRLSASLQSVSHCQAPVWRCAIDCTIYQCLADAAAPDLCVEIDGRNLGHITIRIVIAARRHNSAEPRESPVSLSPRR